MAQAPKPVAPAYELCGWTAGGWVPLFRGSYAAAILERSRIRGTGLATLLVPLDQLRALRYGTHGMGAASIEHGKEKQEPLIQDQGTAEAREGAGGEQELPEAQSAEEVRPHILSKDCWCNPHVE